MRGLGGRGAGRTALAAIAPEAGGEVKKNTADFGLQVFPSAAYSVCSIPSVPPAGNREKAPREGVVEIDLGKGLVAVIDDEDAALVAGFKWYAMKAPQKVAKFYAA